MTALGEEKCRKLVEKLCSGLGWEVKWTPEMPYVLVTSENSWIAFGQTWSEMFVCFYDNVHVFAMSPDIPVWAILCGSPEELALKIEALLP